MNTKVQDIEMLERAILTEARDEAEQIKAQAKEKADAIRKRAQEQAEQERNAILERAREDVERLRAVRSPPRPAHPVVHHETLVHDPAEQLGATRIDPDDPPRRHGRTIYRGV